MKTRVVCAAVSDVNGRLWLGKRHSDCFWLMAQFNTSLHVGADQGFVDQDFNFLTRKEAYIIMAKAKKVLPLNPGQTLENGMVPDLYSEDLY